MPVISSPSVLSATLIILFYYVNQNGQLPQEKTICLFLVVDAIVNIASNLYFLLFFYFLIIIKVQEKISMQIFLYLSTFINQLNRTSCLIQVQIFMKTYKCQENHVSFPPLKLLKIFFASVVSKAFCNLAFELLKCFVHVKANFTVSRKQSFICGKK